MDVRLDGMDKRFDGIDKRFSGIDNRLDLIGIKQERTAKKLDDLQLNVKIAEKNISHKIHKLNDEMETVIEILKQSELIPQ